MTSEAALASSADDARTGWLPAARWLRRYGREMLRADVVAGLTLTAYLLPAAIGDASLARLPPESGLYACLFGSLVFWCLCSARHTAISVTSAISLLIGTSLGAIGDGDPARFAALASATALLVAAFSAGAWLLTGGALIHFVSETVLIGFKVGVALTLASTQLPKLLGISGAHGGFFPCAHHLLTHLHETNPAALAVGLPALAVLLLGKLRFKKVPMALIVVVLGIVVAALAGLDARGVKLLGHVPQGLPPLALPAVAWEELNELLPLAMACFLLAAVETAAIGRMFTQKHGGRFDAKQEMLALAGANLASGMGGGFPVSGGMSQSLVNESAGARTPLSGLVAGVLLVIVALFLSDLLRTLPQPVLAAVVLMAVIGLVDVRALRHLWHADRQELLIALVALAGVLASGLLRGVLIGAVISLLLLIRRASRPHVAFLGRIPGVRRYSDLARNAENERVAELLIFRPEGSLLYFNAEHVMDAVLAEARATPALKNVLCDLSAAPNVDLAGAEMLKRLGEKLLAQGAKLRIVEARSSVRDRLRREGLEEHAGKIDHTTSVADAVDAIVAAGG